MKVIRREKPKSFTFIYPNVEDISDVFFKDVVGKLPSLIQYGGTARVGCHMVGQLVLDVIWWHSSCWMSYGGTARVGCHMVFPVDLISYSNVLR